MMTVLDNIEEIGDRGVGHCHRSTPWAPPGGQKLTGE